MARLTDTQAHHDWKKKLSPAMLERANKIVAARPTLGEKVASTPAMSAPAVFVKQADIPEPDGTLLKLGKSFGNTLMGVATMGSAAPMTVFSKIVEGTTGKKGADWSDALGTFSEDYKGWYGDVLKPQFGAESKWWAGAGLGLDIALDLWWLVAPVKIAKGLKMTTDVAVAAKSTKPRIIDPGNDSLFNSGVRIGDTDTVAAYSQNLDKMPAVPKQFIARRIPEFQPSNGIKEVYESSGGDILHLKVEPEELVRRGYKELDDIAQAEGGWVSMRVSDAREVVPGLTKQANAADIARGDSSTLRQILDQVDDGHIQRPDKVVRGNIGDHLQELAPSVGAAAAMQRKYYVKMLQKMQKGGMSIADTPPQMLQAVVKRVAASPKNKFDEEKIDTVVSDLQSKGGIFDNQGALANTPDDAMNMERLAEYYIAREVKAQLAANKPNNAFIIRDADGLYSLTPAGVKNMTADMIRFRSEAIRAQLGHYAIGDSWRYIDQIAKLTPVSAGAGLTPGAGMARALAQLNLDKGGTLTGAGMANDMIKIGDSAKPSMGVKVGFGKFGYRSRMSGGIRGNIVISKKEFDRLWGETEEVLLKALAGPLKGKIKKAEIPDMVDEIMFEAWQSQSYRSTAKRLGAGDWRARRDYARGENESMKDWLNRMHFEFDTRIPLGKSVMGGIPLAKSLEYQQAKVPSDTENFVGRVGRGLKRIRKYPFYGIRMQPMQILGREMQKSISELNHLIPQKLKESLVRRGYTQDDMKGLWLYSVATDPKMDPYRVESALRQIVGKIDDDVQQELGKIIALHNRVQDERVVSGVTDNLQKLGWWRDDFDEVLTDWVSVRSKLEAATGLESTAIEKLLQWRLPMLLDEASQRRVRNMPAEKAADVTGKKRPLMEGTSRQVDTPARTAERANYLRQYESEEQFAHIIRRSVDEEDLTDEMIDTIDNLAEAINDIYRQVDQTLIPKYMSLDPIKRAFRDAEGSYEDFSKKLGEQLFIRPYQIIYKEKGQITSREMDKEWAEKVKELGFDGRERLWAVMNETSDNDFLKTVDGKELTADKVVAREFDDFLRNLPDGVWENTFKEVVMRDERLVFGIARKSPLRGEAKGRSFSTKEEMFDAQIMGKFEDPSLKTAEDVESARDIAAAMGLLAEMDPAILFGSQYTQALVQQQANKVIPLALMDLPFFEYVQDQNRVLKNWDEVRYDKRATAPEIPGFVKIRSDIADVEQRAAQRMLEDLGFEKINDSTVRVRKFGEDAEGNLQLPRAFSQPESNILYRFTGAAPNKWSAISDSAYTQFAQLLKFSFTTPFFRHFLNNAAGDYFNVMVKAGATGPNTSLKSAMFWQTRSVDPETGLLRWNTRGGLDANRMTSRDFDFTQPVMTINGVSYNGYEIDTMANMIGLGRGFAGSDILHEGKSMAGIDAFFDTYQRVEASFAKTGNVKRVTDKYLSWAARQNIMRENAIRLHSYMANLQQGHSPIMAMWNTVDNIFDYGALTPMEKNLIRHLILFYTWFRKNSSYQIRMAPQRLPYYAAFAGHNLTYQANIYDVDRGELPMGAVSHFMLPNGIGFKFGEMPHADLFEMPDPIDIIGAGNRIKEGDFRGASFALVDQWFGEEGMPGESQADIGQFAQKKLLASSPMAPLLEAITNRRFFTGGETIKYQGQQAELGSALGIFFNTLGIGTPQRQRKDGPLRPAGPPMLAAFENFAGPVTAPLDAVFDMAAIAGVGPYDRRGEGTTKTQDFLLSLSQLLGVNTLKFRDETKEQRLNKQRRQTQKAAATRIKNARAPRE